MAKAPPAILTRIPQAHTLIAIIQFQRIRYQGWKEARSVKKARKKSQRSR